MEFKRKIITSDAFEEFKSTLTERVLTKLEYSMAILKTAMPINTKIVKKIIESDFYELRISVDNEIRVILFAVDNLNINLASTIIFLNGFVKKSNKDYKPAINKAINILIEELNKLEK